MDRYIHDQNLAHYRKVLCETTDLTMREIVLKLLAEEQASFRLPTERGQHFRRGGSAWWQE
jgi:hypothetical protein